MKHYAGYLPAYLFGTMSIDVKTTQDPVLERLQAYFTRSAATSNAEIPHTDADVEAVIRGRRDQLREAAVLVPVIRPTTAFPAQVILTVRSDRLSSHAGQISLPGGSRDPTDSDIVATALRESAEEIGLDGSKVEILGKLGEILLPSGFRVTPVIGLLDHPPNLSPCPREVQEIFMAPAGLVLDPSAYTLADWHYSGRMRQVLELHYGRYRIWGATAIILRHLGRSISA